MKAGKIIEKELKKNQKKTNPNQNCLFIPNIKRAFDSNEKLLAQNHYIID